MEDGRQPGRGGTGIPRQAPAEDLARIGPTTPTTTTSTRARVVAIPTTGLNFLPSQEEWQVGIPSTSTSKE
eukprot:2664327-Rhodomonas_salina.2